MDVPVAMTFGEFVAIDQGYLFPKDYASKMEILGDTLFLKVRDQRYDMFVAINFGEMVFSLPMYSPLRGLSVDIFVIFF